MKKFFKFGCLGVIVLVILGVILASLGGDDTASTNSEGESTETSSDSGDTEEEQTYVIGDKVEVGKMAFTVNEKTTASTVGPEMFQEEANGKYVLVDVTVINNGNEANTVDSSMFKLKFEDKTYEADSGATMSANEDSVEFFLAEVNPDSTIEGKVAFDINAETADQDGLKLQVSEGVFGTNTKTIDLK
ncbi:DUF4352 domain-containing protein [Halobacillus litoralis]|uniref:DUF4352 domain-containing protein n=1 Tax=Halobacillus litoralis TaxID=45668 RepID=A0A845DW08_9BACI|nr:DUF4352 domain-containing protein [Halobacillus litoralis]MYL18267.1 DUF4352 domain-containing protein [Halobacillus litoralis]MYL38742.1 DUF4352 domain-containing protein [Halobacillus litoralis]